MLSDDFPLEPLPSDRQIGWIKLTVMRFGQFATLAQLLVGSTLGATMRISNAFIALAVGIIVLLVVAIPMGIIGQRTGLATSRLTRVIGLGSGGSALFSLISGVAVMGWFGVQNALFAQGIRDMVTSGPLWLWILLSGLVVTVLVVGGILLMGWAAYITVPLFVLLMALGTFHALQLHHPHQITPLLSHESLTSAITIVVGSFILGAVLSPDMTRFQKSAKDVVLQSTLSFVVGVGLFSGVGVTVGHYLHQDNITGALALGGMLGWVLFVTSTLKVSDWDIYGASLALVNSLDVFGIQALSRRNMAIIVGALGTIAGIMGIVNNFVPFLTLLGVAIPPVASIIIVAYFFFQSAPVSKLGAALAWTAGFASGEWIHWGIPSCTSLVVAAFLYWLYQSVAQGQKSRALSGSIDSL